MTRIKSVDQVYFFSTKLSQQSTINNLTGNKLFYANVFECNGGESFSMVVRVVKNLRNNVLSCWSLPCLTTRFLQQSRKDKPNIGSNLLCFFRATVVSSLCLQQE